METLLSEATKQNFLQQFCLECVYVCISVCVATFPYKCMYIYVYIYEHIELCKVLLHISKTLISMSYILFVLISKVVDHQRMLPIPILPAIKLCLTNCPILYSSDSSC